MRYTHLLIISSLLAVMSCSGSGNGGNDTNTFSPDTVTMAVDTATALPEPEEKVTPEPVVESPRLDSLASAEAAVEFMENSDHWNEYQEGIIPSILKQNLDYGRRLLRNRHDYFVIVDKQTMHLILYDKYGRQQKSYLMACSRKYGTKHKRRDNRTPEGFFTAQGIYDSTDWLYTDDDGRTSPVKGQFGPRFIRLKTPVSSQIGIHGTSAPWSPGHRASHGCIRLKNENILDLVKYVRAGMPVIVNPSDRDQKVNREEEVEVVQLDLGSGIRDLFKEEKEREKKAEEEAKAKADSIARLKAAEAETEIVPDSAAVHEEKHPEPDTTSTDPDFFD